MSLSTSTTIFVAVLLHFSLTLLHTLRYYTIIIFFYPSISCYLFILTGQHLFKHILKSLDPTMKTMNVNRIIILQFSI